MVDDPRHNRPDLAAAAPVDVQATFCATLVDQWIRLGVRHAVVCPGSRSTPLALALAERDELVIHVVHDERVAGFVALGLGVAPSAGVDAPPALLLCTSGTAAANFLPAVVEAGLSAIPMLVLTADRPEELRGVGAPQTIDQLDLYGRHVAWFRDPGVADAATSGEWRHLAAQAWSASACGPAHLNLPFREPLVGSAAALPPTIEPIEPTLLEVPERTDPVPVDVATTRGVILVGGAHGVHERDVLELHRRTRWPIIADAQSGMRAVTTVSTIDSLLRIEAFADEMVPDVIVRIGRPSTSKVLAAWTARHGPTLVQVGGPGRVDPARNVAAVCELTELLAAATAAPDDSVWLERWVEVERLSAAALADALRESDVLTEPLVARLLAEHVPDGSHVTVSSSMPIRDLEWFGGRAASAYANRGANGIDGVTSTALGRALSRLPEPQPGFVLIGDLAFVHDSNALVAITARGVDLRVVVVDNGGGGIFSFLSQRSQLAHERFEQLFGTPLGTDVLALASSHGLATAEIRTSEELVAQIERPGPWVCRVASDRTRNVEDHARLNAAVAAAISR